VFLEIYETDTRQMVITAFISRISQHGGIGQHTLAVITQIPIDVGRN